MLRLIICVILCFEGVSFLSRLHLIKNNHVFTLNLYKNLDFPLSSTLISNSKWDFGLLETNDMENVVDLSMEAFFQPRLSVKRGTNLNLIEKFFMNSIINSFTSFETFDGRLSNYLGFTTRGGSRLSSPNLQPSKDSIIFAATEKGKSNIVGVVEISLEPVDGKLGKPIKFPWRESPGPNDEAYLCNLCVAKSQRRKGLALLLCELCESVVADVWKKEYIYLHVERQNIAAQELYVGIGYETAESPLSMIEKQLSNMQDLSYYRKRMNIVNDSKSAIVSDNANGCFDENSGHQGHASRKTDDDDYDDDDANDLGISPRDFKIASNNMKER